MLFVTAIGALMWAARRRPGPQLALALALPAYVLHGFVDIGWDIAAVSAPVFLAAGALVARPERARRVSASSLLVAGGAALAIACSLVVLWLADRWAREASLSLDRPARAVELAKRSRSLNPLAVEPLVAQANAETVRRNPAAAFGLLREATRVQPESADAWFALGDFDLRIRNCPRAALPSLDRFTQLDPQSPGNKEYDLALKLVNSGAPVC